MPERFDLVIVGMGAGGMVAAEFAAGLGISVAVIEQARVGGQRLWTGAVPSKALIASARVAHTVRRAAEFGVQVPAAEIDVDLDAVWRRLHTVRDQIATTDDEPTRFEDMGVRLLRGKATLTGPQSIRVSAPTRREIPAGEPRNRSDPTIEIEARFTLLCTGSHPELVANANVDGLAEAGCLTVDELFDLDTPPRRLVLLGSGSVAVELAQACNRLGIACVLLEPGARLLPGAEPELVSLLAQRLKTEGVALHTGVELRRVGRATAGGPVVVDALVDGADQTFTADEVLVAGERRPNLDGLGLDEAGVHVTDAGIEVDERLRTNVPSIYAAGDVTGRHRSAHAAAYEAVLAVRNMFFPGSLLPGRGRATYAVPSCTFTDPELASIGFTVAEAEARYGDDVQVWRQDLVHSDRARADGATDGAIMILTHRNKILGAHLLAPAAGELVNELALAMREGVSLSSLGSLVHAYPTLSTTIFELAGGAAFEKAESFRWLVRKERRSGPNA